MRNHTKVYFKEMGYCISDFIYCEVCQQEAVDIHHIDARGQGGSKKKDHIENLMAVCRKCHIEYGDVKDLKPKLREIHTLRMKERGIKKD